MYDHDADSRDHAQTACIPCPRGTFSNYSEITCHLCEAGRSDEDEDAATPCALCGEGIYTGIGDATSLDYGLWPIPPDRESHAGWPGWRPPEEATGAFGVCCSHSQYLEDHEDDPDVPQTPQEWAVLDSHDCPSGHCCPAGTVDNDTDPATPCTDCQPGGYTMPCSTVCGPCHEGRADLDNDPSTPCDDCVAGMFSIDTGHCVLCDAGKTDHDSDSATACVDCPEGSFSDRGEYTCHECEPGRYDDDAGDVELSAATPCEACDPGQYSGRSSLMCYDCHAGKVDHDANPATP